MTGKQIRELIEQKNAEIRELLTPNFFTLNNFVAIKRKEIEELQNQCPHHFIDGFCEYCQKKEDIE